jgi:hypothetical protein
MYPHLVRKTLASAALLFTSLHCSSGSGGGGMNQVLLGKCSQMCDHLLAAPLLGCGKSDASDLETCKAECYEHVTPKRAGEPPEADEADLDCAITASDCAAWSACGDLL